MGMRKSTKRFVTLILEEEFGGRSVRVPEKEYLDSFYTWPNKAWPERVRYLKNKFEQDVTGFRDLAVKI